MFCLLFVCFLTLDSDIFYLLHNLAWFLIFQTSPPFLPSPLALSHSSFFLLIILFIETINKYLAIKLLPNWWQPHNFYIRRIGASIELEERPMISWSFKYSTYSVKFVRLHLCLKWIGGMREMMRVLEIKNYALFSLVSQWDVVWR